MDLVPFPVALRIQFTSTEPTERSLNILNEGKNEPVVYCEIAISSRISEQAFVRTVSLKNEQPRALRVLITPALILMQIKFYMNEIILFATVY